MRLCSWLPANARIRILAERIDEMTPDPLWKGRDLMKSYAISGVGLCAALAIAACSQDREPIRPAGAPPLPAAGAPAPNKPAPFDKGPVKIALVQYSGAGDYFELWTKGAQQQADAIGF